MKTPRIVNAVGHIDDDLISSAAENKKSVRKNIRIKWVSLAACFAVIAIVAVAVNSEITPPALTQEDSIYAGGEENNTDDTFCGNYWVVGDSVSDSTPSVNESTGTQTNSESSTQAAVSNEAVYSEAYFYNVSGGVFSSYTLCGKVIEEEKINGKVDDVTVSAGWQNSFGEWLTTETLRAEVYLISDISKDVAVALKFIDKGEALTTTHYYVIMNPESDLSSVKEYLIAPPEPNNIGDEAAGEAVDNVTLEYAVEHTSQGVNE